MVDNTSVATKPALGSFSSRGPSGGHLLVSGSPPVRSSPGCSSAPGPGVGVNMLGGGLKLEAVMETLQRQQAARLERERREREMHGLLEARLHQQHALALRHYQAAAPQHRPGLIMPPVRKASPAPPEEDYDEEEDEEEEVVAEEPTPPRYLPPPRALQPPGSPQGAPRTPTTPLPGHSHSPTGAQGHHEWTYEEQFKQLYELDEDPKRKEFLDDLFSYMQKRGTPVNRIPIMAKQVLDLYSLFRLVTEKGGLVEVINKKIWREITKGLNLPTSITSAAFTLRTQYMKYLYPYECEKRGLSSPGELQAAIDSNRREGRRQSFGSSMFNYSPVGTPNMLSSPKIPMSSLSITTHNGGQFSHMTPIKKEESMMSSAIQNRLGIPVNLAGHHLKAAQVVAVQAAQAAQAAAIEQLREKLESGEPPEKKMALMAAEQQRLMQHALQQNLLAMASQFPMNIKINSRDDRQETALNLSTNSISSINMSIEINGVVYTGVLFARRPVVPTASSGGSSSNSVSDGSQGSASPAMAPNQPMSSSSHNHTPASSSP
ncbi:AT-rich interactive domain-containing protein 3C [Ambystoma mexicanum]|uniref:AT-rich interactive domain-containing protein 3C n=1 Tax=Ambystoma mexicanum TaxID=8296 RepID=UPI0037E7B17D